jgi:PPOX class probable F420-dependent enzyme
MLTIDPTTDFGARAARRLRDELIGWLVTVDASGTPQPSPVWFLWEEESATILIYSQPDAPKLRNIAANPRVALHLDGDGKGGDIVVLTGEARSDATAPAATAVPAYVEKYRQGIADIGMDPDAFAAAYSVPMRMTPLKLRGH